MTIIKHKSLKDQLIRLGYERPDLRQHLRPVLSQLETKTALTGMSTVAGRIFLTDAPYIKVQFAVMLEMPVQHYQLRELYKEVQNKREGLTQSIEGWTEGRITHKSSVAQPQGQQYLRVVTTLDVTDENTDDPENIEAYRQALYVGAGVEDVEVID